MRRQSENIVGKIFLNSLKSGEAAIKNNEVRNDFLQLWNVKLGIQHYRGWLWAAHMEFGGIRECRCGEMAIKILANLINLLNRQKRTVYEGASLGEPTESILQSRV